MIYKPNIGYTVKHDLCTGCGVCEDACPSHAIHVDVKKGCFRPIVDNEMCLNNKGCHRCYDCMSWHRGKSATIDTRMFY